MTVLYDVILSLTDRRQLVLHLQHDPLPDILQQTDDLIMTKFGQVDPIHRLYVVAHVQLVTPAKKTSISETEGDVHFQWNNG